MSTRFCSIVAGVLLLLGACGSDAASYRAHEGPRVWLLTDSQHANAIRDLLGDVDVPRVVTPGVADDLFIHEAELYRVGGALLHQYRISAEAAADRAVARLDALLPCDPEVTGETACARAFIGEFAARAFRRPLSAVEVAELERVYQVGRADGFDAGIALVIEAVLQAPDFLYRTELGPAGDDSAVFELTPFELASSVSFLLLDSIPDDALWAAALDGSLTDPAVLADHVDRLLATPRVQAHLTDVVLTWMGAHRIQWLAKNPDRYPAFDAALARSMVAETSRFVDDVLWQRDGRLAGLLTSTETFVDERLAALYGVPDVAGSEFVAVDLGPTRSGVLTHASVLAGLSGPVDSSIVRRGLFVQRALLCADFGPPPTEAIAAVEDELADLTERELADFRAGDPTCAPCHAVIDPAGIAFEHYDAIGQWRDEADGVPVRATAPIALGDDPPVEVTGAPELGALLAEHPAVAACIVDQFLQRALGRSLTAADASSRELVRERFDSAQRDLVEIFRAIPHTEAFRWRERTEAP